MNSRILIVEDDVDINELLTKTLTENGYSVISAYSGSEAKLLLQSENFDCLLLDLMLPGVDGETLIGLIRKQLTVPIIVISAKLGTDARVSTLRMGADDFISKPFENAEVLARIEAQLRRSQLFSTQSSVDTAKVYHHKNCVLDSVSMTVTVNDKLIDFTALEYQIFALFIQNPKRVFTRDNIFTHCWKQEHMGDDNTIDVHISHIRNKIGKHDAEEYIKTVRGIGYRLSI